MPFLIMKLITKHVPFLRLGLILNWHTAGGLVLVRHCKGEEQIEVDSCINIIFDHVIRKKQTCFSLTKDKIFCKWNCRSHCALAKNCCIRCNFFIPSLTAYCGCPRVPYTRRNVRLIFSVTSLKIFCCLLPFSTKQNSSKSAIRPS